MQDREALNLLVLVTADAVHTVFVLVISDTESPQTMRIEIEYRGGVIFYKLGRQDLKF